MSVERLPELALALYSELLDLTQMLAAEERDLPIGSFVSKIVAGRRYWYLQTRGAGIRHQRYLGPESPELLAKKKRIEERRAELEPDRQRLQALHDALVASGATPESAAATRVLELLAAAGFFRAGAVLVGTRAFGALATSLGIKASALARTQDFDVAVDAAIALAFPHDADRELAELLASHEAPFAPIPQLDPRRPSTSFRIRRRELRVDFLTPRHGREDDEPVVLPRLGLAATPLRFLDYLIADSIPAVVVGTRPLLVRVPQPARFALHKLHVAARRPASEAARATKDVNQAGTLIEALHEDHPADLDRAIVELRRYPGLAATVRSQARRLGNDFAGELTRRLDPA